jgi:peroxygenase
LEQVFAKFSKDGKISFNDLWRMTNHNRCVFDFFGYFASKLEWSLTYALLWEKGYMTKEDMMKVIDGTLFFEKDAHSC